MDSSDSDFRTRCVPCPTEWIPKNLTLTYTELYGAWLAQCVAVSQEQPCFVKWKAKAYNNSCPILNVPESLKEKDSLPAPSRMRDLLNQGARSITREQERY